MSIDARLSTGLPAHPKTKKLIRRVGEAGAWHLVCLILWTRANRTDGDLAGMTAEDIELAVDWRGEADALVAALAAVGFLDGEEGAYRLHDWAEHQPWAAGSEDRSDRAKWAALCRREGRESAAMKMPEYAAKLANSTKSPANSNGESANSSGVAQLESANSTDTPAPSPIPSPSPSPSPKAEDKNPPTDAAGTQRKPKPTRCTYATFIQACREAGERPIQPADPIFAFADDAQIPREFIALAWRAFAAKHRAGRKQQAGVVGWRAHFRDAVRGNWAKLWYFPSEGAEAALTTVGIALSRERDAEAGRKADHEAAA